MQVVPTPFLDAQPSPEFRDAVSYIAGCVAGASGLDFYLEAAHGVEQAKKLNFRHERQTRMVLWILKDQLRLEIRDPTNQVQSALLMNAERADGHGWRNYYFDPRDPSQLANAVGLIKQFTSTDIT